MPDPATHQGFFLVLEGLDGSGKSEAARRLAQLLRNTLGLGAKITFEPHDPSAGGLFIRQVLTHRIKATPRILALAFALNRLDHLNREVAPFLSEAPQRVVISDRYYLSSLVYQSAPDVPMDEVLRINSGARTPDLTLFLNASTQTCYERMNRRQLDPELFERNLSETREKYLTAIRFLRQQTDQRIVEINADHDLPNVMAQIADALRTYGPPWLSLPDPLPALSPAQGFDHDLTYDDSRAQTALVGLKGLQAEEIESALGRLPYADLAQVFLWMAQRSGLRLIERFPWPDLIAYSLEADLPLGLSQSGTAVLLNSGQRYDLVTKKLADLGRFSDFLLIFDPDPARLPYYEREPWLLEGETVTGTPHTRIIGLNELAAEIQKR